MKPNELIIELLILATCCILALVLFKIPNESSAVRQPIPALDMRKSPKVTKEAHFNPGRHVIALAAGRLGNQMFSYAALIGIATMNNMTPVCMGAIPGPLVEAFELENLAAIKNAFGFSLKPENTSLIKEQSYALFDRRFQQLHMLAKPDVAVGTYFQSWKYFHRISSEVRQAFSLRTKHVDTVHRFLTNSSADLRTNNQTAVFVGVHLRRTDWKQGMPNHDVGDQGYLHKAVRAMIEKLNLTGGQIIFVVCSDELSWARANFQSIVDNVTAAISSSSLSQNGSNVTSRMSEPRVVFSPGFSASEDLTMLAACNHTIITIGTFGWWGAWLAGGLTVAFGKYPFFPEKLLVTREDYYPPDWIIIS